MMNTREKIIENTRLLIQSNGYDGLSLQTIAKKTHISAPALYKHFANKEELFDEVILVVSKAYQGSFSDLLKVAPKKALILLTKRIVQLFRDEPHLMTFLYFSPNATKLYTAHNGVGISDDLGEKYTYRIIARVAEAYALEVETKILYLQFWSFLQGYITLINHQVTAYDEKLIEKTIDAFISSWQ